VYNFLVKGYSLTQKIFISMSLLVLASLWGCASGYSQPQTADLVIFVPSGSEAEAIKAAARDYQQETGRIVKVDEAGADTYLSKVENALLAGSEDMDLVYLSASQLPLWINYHALQPVTDPVNSRSIGINEQSQEILRPWLTNLTYSNQIYGFPTQPALEVLWYRSDWLQAAGLPVPASWDELRAAAQKLSHAPERYGIALAAGGNGPGLEFGAVLASFGGQIFAAPTGPLENDLRNPPAISLTMSQPETQQALAFYGGLWQTGTLAVPEGLAGGRQAVAAALQEGHAAMGILPLTMAATLLDCQASPRVCTPPEGGAQPLLGFARLPGLPQGVAAGELGAWAIPLHAAHAQAARDFGVWLVGPAGAWSWASNGGIPAGYPPDMGGTEPANSEPLLAKVPYLAMLKGVQEYRLPYPPVKPNDEVEATLRAGLHALAAGQVDLPAATQQMTQELRHVFYRSGYTVK
jgi:ABC-type glycerol-3-phosphate transport system substrate-binding protein